MGTSSLKRRVRIEYMGGKWFRQAARHPEADPEAFEDANDSPGSPGEPFYEALMALEALETLETLGEPDPEPSEEAPQRPHIGLV